MPQLCWMKKSNQEAVMDQRAALQMRTERGTYNRAQSRPWWLASWEATLTMSIPRGSVSSTQARGHHRYWMHSAFLKRVSPLNPLDGPADWPGEPAVNSTGACFSRALFSPWRTSGSCLAVGEPQPVDQLFWGTVYMWINISVEILGNRAGGRLFCYMDIQKWVSIKLLLSLWCYKRNSFGFYIKKKKQAAFRLYGDKFLILKLILNRNIQFKVM